MWFTKGIPKDNTELWITVDPWIFKTTAYRLSKKKHKYGKQRNKKNGRNVRTKLALSEDVKRYHRTSPLTRWLNSRKDLVAEKALSRRKSEKKGCNLIIV
ncbi:unnamed protein product [Boreogadus saida]